jgi:hypothetical protein
MPLRTETATTPGSDNELHTITYIFPPEADESEKFPWLRHDYDVSTESPLCLNCRRLDFGYILCTLCPDRIYLGDFKTVRDRNCALCRMVVSDLRIAPLFRNGGIGDSDGVYLSTQRRGGDPNWKTATSEMAGPPSTTLSIIITRNSLDTIPKVIFGVAHGTVHAIREQGNKHPEGLTATPLPDRCDPALIRSWLRDCPPSSPPLNVLLEEDHPFSHIKRFVDTMESRLVEVRSSGNFRVPSGAPFAALSYVWGKGERQVTLTKSVKERFHEKNGIASAGLSKTITDAIRLCQDIGIRYLWVDALCIVQDDDEPAKIKQINNLHHIYLNAAVTIVAAFGDTADAGLPRVDQSSSVSRRARVTIQDMLFSKQCADLDDVLYKTYWNSRAWTSQEFILSPRRLVFTEDTIYFVCTHGVRSEEIRGPPHSSGLEYHGDLERSGLDFKLKTQFAWTIYADLVSNYTTRELTNERDILPAFAALSEVLREELYSGCPFVSGLPFCSLDAALLWRRCLGCESCKNTSRGLVKRGGKHAILSLDAPSWSWASWVGHVRYSPWIMGSKNPAWSVITKVKWLEVRDPGKLEGPAFGRLLAGVPPNIPQESKRIETWRPPSFLGSEFWKPRGWLTVAGGSSFLNQFLYREPVTHGFTDRNLVHPWTKHLFVEADVATFVVGCRQMEGDFEIRETGNYVLNSDSAEGGKYIDMGGEFGNPVGLYDMESKQHCGVAYDDFDLSTLGIRPGTKCDFVKLSQTSNGEILVGSPPESVMHASGDPSKREVLPTVEKAHMKLNMLNSFFAEDYYDTSDTWCIYNVLMVVWERTERVAFRVGIGKIHADAFDKASTFKHKQFFLG